ncbi:DUF535 family protein [Dyella sp. ASV21]|uniref:VirK/YbjX family protein n=1 Tax=Dyella sp. ASV21 TaxID=2795114 RepID=UPI0018EA9CA4|nr:DUF535 family protein [Dyella sp. ASV21]
MNERTLLPGEEPLDAELVFAASGCAFAAQRGLERELRTAGALSPRVAGPLESHATDGHFGWGKWFASLRDRHDWAGSPSQRRVSAAKYLVRAIGMAVSHHRFLTFLQDHPLMRAAVARDPRLQERHLHRFVNRHWHRPTRLRSIESHYRSMLKRMPATLFEAVYVRGRATLGELALKDDSRLQLHLRPSIAMGCEGELGLELTDTNGSMLYRLVFTVIDEVRPTLTIGCIQGPDGEDGRERVRVLTRQMHGMRPKQLMLELAYAFAEAYGIKYVLAVGNEAHPLHKRRRFLADYDAFWLEQGGVALNGGWYVLPETLHHRSEADVPSKHRSSYRKRGELRAQAAQLISQALIQPARWPERERVEQGVELPRVLPAMLEGARWTS